MVEFSGDNGAVSKVSSVVPIRKAQEKSSNGAVASDVSQQAVQHDAVTLSEEALSLARAQEAAAKISAQLSESSGVTLSPALDQTRLKAL